MAKEHAVWWVLGGLVLVGLASRGSYNYGLASGYNAGAGAAGPSPAGVTGGNFFSNLFSSINNLGAGAAGAGNQFGSGGLLQPINYNPVNYGSPAPSPATPTPGGGFNNLASLFGGGGSPASPTGINQYLV